MIKSIKGWKLKKRSVYFVCNLMSSSWRDPYVLIFMLWFWSFLLLSQHWLLDTFQLNELKKIKVTFWEKPVEASWLSAPDVTWRPPWGAVPGLFHWAEALRKTQDQLERLCLSDDLGMTWGPPKGPGGSDLGQGSLLRLLPREPVLGKQKKMDGKRRVKFNVPKINLVKNMQSWTYVHINITETSYNYVLFFLPENISYKFRNSQNCCLVEFSCHFAHFVWKIIWNIDGRKLITKNVKYFSFKECIFYCPGGGSPSFINTIYSQKSCSGQIVVKRQEPKAGLEPNKSWNLDSTYFRHRFFLTKQEQTKCKLLKNIKTTV